MALLQPGIRMRRSPSVGARLAKARNLDIRLTAFIMLALILFWLLPAEENIFHGH